MQKILKVVFVILILVTIGELGYYFYILRFSNSKRINTVQKKTSQNTPTGNIYENTSQASDQLEGSSQVMINPDFLTYLSQYSTAKKVPNAKMLYIMQTEGTIVDIDPDGSQSYDNVRYPFGVKIKNSQNPDGYWFHFIDNLYNKTIVYDNRSEELIPVGFDTLEKDQHIVIEDISDMSFPPSNPDHTYMGVIKIIQ